MKLFNITFNHKRLYFIGLILTAICLPLSKFALSVSMIFLICNWILELDFRRKWDILKSNKTILVFTGIFLVHILWLLNTHDFKFAFHDLSNKAIIVLYPIIIGTSIQLNYQQVKRILIWFSIAVVSSTIISSLILFQIIDYPIQNVRNISPFISHIRLSLLINIAIFSLGYLLLSGKFKLLIFEKIAFVTFIIWLIIFLFLLKSYTGIIVFIVVLFIILGLTSFKIKDIVPRLFLQLSLITLFLVLASFLTHSIARYYTREIVDINNLEKLTINGNEYLHDFNLDQLENGNYVWIYLCEEEIKKEWDKISSIPYNGKDKKGEELKYTLTRYLTSKGYRKDSVGISKLSQQDINNIEAGIANYIFENKYAIYPKIYDAIWQIDMYKKGFDPSKSSITLRFEYAKTAFDIIKDNFWFGVGTGDVQDAFNKQYLKNECLLPPTSQLRAHNQYITFFLSFGVIGFIILFYCLLYPAIKLNGFKNYLFLILLLIALLSFINEDTLETQIGITFFSYFYSLFLFGSNLNLKTEEDDK